MKTFLALLAILALPATTGFAHIGETVSQCESRYGKPVFTNKEYRNYEKDGIVIAITFNAPQPDGAGDAATNREMKGTQAPEQTRAIEVIYTRKVEHTYFSADEVKALLAANAGPGAPPPGAETWKPVQRKKAHEDYLRFDNQASARVYWKYVDASNVAKKIRIQMDSHLRAEKKEEKHPDKSSDKLDTIEKDF